MKPNKQFNRMMRKLKDDKKYHIFKDYLKEKQMIYLSSYSSYHLVSIFHPSLEKYINNLYKNISFLHNEKFLEKFGDYHASFSPPKTIEEIEEFCEFCDSYGILWRSHNRVIDLKKVF